MAIIFYLLFVFVILRE